MLQGNLAAARSTAKATCHGLGYCTLDIKKAIKILKYAISAMIAFQYYSKLERCIATFFNLQKQ